MLTLLPKTILSQITTGQLFSFYFSFDCIKLAKSSDYDDSNFLKKTKICTSGNLILPLTHCLFVAQKNAKAPKETLPRQRI